MARKSEHAGSVLTKGTRVTGESRDRLQAELKRRYEAGASIRTLAQEQGHEVAA